jgi:cell division protein FtsI/penicillin-binding protein 2
LAVTPLQMIAAHGALANGGKLISPKLVLRTLRGPADGEVELRLATSIVSRATDRETARWLVAGPMRDVVLQGTGTRANLPGYSVFGKTGTAQKLDPETKTYSADKYVSSFLCGAPAAAPKVLVLVVVDEPTTKGTHYGGTVAAPAAAEILRQTLTYLRVVPDESSDRPNDSTADRRR